MKTAPFLIFAVIAAGLAWIRLAPSDPARWHVAPGDTGPARSAGGTDAIREVAGGATARLTFAGQSPERVLARLDKIALDTPRTRRFAGSPEDGMITWITRSAVFGFPDYTTAAARSEGRVTMLALHARQRFGRHDFGVNAARLRAWTGALRAR